VQLCVKLRYFRCAQNASPYYEKKRYVQSFSVEQEEDLLTRKRDYPTNLSSSCEYVLQEETSSTGPGFSLTST
jgi:hypothetical protein